MFSKIYEFCIGLLQLLADYSNSYFIPILTVCVLLAARRYFNAKSNIYEKIGDYLDELELDDIKNAAKKDIPESNITEFKK